MESLNVKTKAGCAAVMTAASLFAQWAHWFIFEKIEFSSFYLFFTPLVLCFMYRLLMADSENGGRFSKPFIFIFTVALPLAAAFIISVFMLLNYPDISMFSAVRQESGIPSELIALYSGRIFITSVYLLAYSGIDIFISKIWRNLKKSGK